MWRINYPLVNKIRDAESHFIQISFDFAVIRNLIFLDQPASLELKHSLMGYTMHFLKEGIEQSGKENIEGKCGLNGRGVDCDATVSD